MDYIMRYIHGIERRIKKYSSLFYFRLSHKGKSFAVGKNRYAYFSHQYNYTWINERAIEIPIFLREVEKNKRKDILEIGNVLTHYFSMHHDVLDKYEKGIGVINKDVEKYKTKKKYDLIISISTLEHVGWDEKKKEKRKIQRSLINLHSMLKKNGKIMFTVPIGHNTFLDESIKNETLNLTKAIYLMRISPNNFWETTTKAKAIKNKYNTPFPNANAVMLGIITK